MEMSGAGAVAVLCAVLLGACAPPPPPLSTGHLQPPPPTPAAAIPPPVSQVPILPPPRPAPPLETYTVVVDDVPLRELLFALARDASLNVDIHPDVSGRVTMNAVDQTLPRILDRISRQVDLRYEITDAGITLSPDLPYWRMYQVDYVNMSREADSRVGVSTEIFTDTSVGGGGGGGGGGAGGGPSSETRLVSTSGHKFWESLEQNIRSILQPSDAAGEKGVGPAADAVIVNRESGVVVVRATSHQQEEVQGFLDRVMTSVRRQVLIEATIVEVELNDEYRSGIDWSIFEEGRTDIAMNALTDVKSELPSTLVVDLTRFVSGKQMDVAVELLQRFGDARVLSSPKIMALNNQTALLKVVDNVVYFEVQSQTSQAVQGGTLTSAQTTPKTVAVGLVMNVTPQVAGNDTVTLNIRPTTSRVIGFKKDPNPALAQVNEGLPPDEQVQNLVPETRVREFESVLKVNSGQVAVLGGLMQDESRRDREETPGFAEIPLLGELFRARDYEAAKTELVVFLKPTVVREPSLNGDFVAFKPFLQRNVEGAGPPPEAQPE
jgi:MSHA biogenesis protein MshL